MFGSMNDLLCQLAQVFFQEYKWNRKDNLSVDNEKSECFVVNKCIIRKCSQITKQSTFVIFTDKHRWFSDKNQIEEPFPTTTTITTLLEEIRLRLIPAKKQMTERGYAYSKKQEERKDCVHREVKVREEHLDFCRKSSQLLVKWMNSLWFDKKDSNSLKLELWLGSLLDEKYDAFEFLVRHFYEAWKTQYARHCFKPASVVSLYCTWEELSPPCLLEKSKDVSLQKFSKWSHDAKHTTDTLPNENVLQWNGVEYDDPLDDFLDITSNETRDQRKQKYRPEEETEETFSASLQNTPNANRK
jgi:hypothetical protein